MMFFKKVIIWKKDHFLGINELFKNRRCYELSAKVVSEKAKFFVINLKNIKKCFTDFKNFYKVMKNLSLVMRRNLEVN